MTNFIIRNMQRVFFKANRASITSPCRHSRTSGASCLLHCRAKTMQIGPTTASQSFNSIFDVTEASESLEGADAAAFHRIFAISSGISHCNVGPELATKYSLEEDNKQHVVSLDPSLFSH